MMNRERLFEIVTEILEGYEIKRQDEQSIIDRIFNKIEANRSRAIINISNATASVVSIPKGVEVEIRDFDGDQQQMKENNCPVDEDGDLYQKIILTE